MRLFVQNSGIRDIEAVLGVHVFAHLMGANLVGKRFCVGSIKKQIKVNHSRDKPTMNKSRLTR
jgi:hypothetical protein